MAFIDSGPRAAPVILLVHGLGSTAATWKRLIPRLARHFRVIAADLPGHGRSEPAHGDYSPGAHACSLRDLLTALDVETATVVGHSLGGGVAMQFTYQFPERVERLSLIATAGLGTEVASGLKLVTLPLASPLLRGAGWIPRPVIARMLEMATGHAPAIDNQATAEDISRLRSARHREAFMSTARVVLDRRGQRVDAVARLSAFDGLPLLMVWGANDPVIPPEHQMRGAEQLHAEALQLEDAGHYPHVSHVAPVATALTTFIQRSEPHEYETSHWRGRMMG